MGVGREGPAQGALLPLGLACPRLGPVWATGATGEGGRAASRVEGVALAPPVELGCPLSLACGGQPFVPAPLV